MNASRLVQLLGLVMIVGLIVALGAGWSLANRPDAGGIEVGARAAGDALIVQGPEPLALAAAASTSGRVDVQAIDEGGRWSALQSKDTMDATAEFTHPADGATYRVVMRTPMRQEPQGAYTTWFGVSLGHAHHGDTGIDSPALPRVAAELALWSLADVYRNGQLIAAGRPAHLMVVRNDQGQLPGQVLLTVATEARDLPGVPDGYLTVAWREVAELTTPATQGIDLHQVRESGGARWPATSLGDLAQIGRREALGYGVLLFAVAATLLLALRPWPVRPRQISDGPRRA